MFSRKRELCLIGGLKARGLLLICYIRVGGDEAAVGIGARRTSMLMPSAVDFEARWREAACTIENLLYPLVGIDRAKIAAIDGVAHDVREGRALPQQGFGIVIRAFRTAVPYRQRRSAS